MKKRFRVIGHPISQSLSPALHAYFARQCGLDLEYQALDLLPDAFIPQLRKLFAEGFSGFSVTSPFKLKALELADVILPHAEKAASANTLWRQKGQIYADNTDGRGLIQDLLENHAYSLLGKRVLILGAGGATQGIVGPLLEAGAEITVANRSILGPSHFLRSISGLRLLCFNELSNPFDLVIHATSAGLGVDSIDFPFRSIMSRVFAYDLSYSLSGETPFTRWAKSAGADQIVDGWGMLVEQAVLQFENFHGLRPDSKALISSRLACWSP
jgi:shikimate dehydrogenase